MATYSFLTRCLRKPTAVFRTSHDACLSHRLFCYAGLISQSSPGVFVLWPMFMRVLNKLGAIVQTKMSSLGAQMLLLPTLGDERIWTKSGRWNDAGQLFKLHDRNGKQYCLQPTHEEEITSLVGSLEISYKDLPLLLYQISNKFRDELRPRYGLIRCREFIMKDMYSFDRCPNSALDTYHSISNAYSELLSDLRLPYHKVLACAGPIGGHLSHEYHIPSSVGEDILCICQKCGKGYNAELEDGVERIGCTDSSCSHEFQKIRGSEVGHCFLLGRRYSSCFDANYHGLDGKQTLEMGCYGLGLTRLVAVGVEYLSTAAFPDLPNEQISEIRWPQGLAPYRGCIVLQKETAKDAMNAEELNSIFDILADASYDLRFPGDILVDDRPGLSLGRKLVDIRRLGIPWIAILKSSAGSLGPFELIDLHRGRSHAAVVHEIRSAFEQPTLFDSSALPEWDMSSRKAIG